MRRSSPMKRILPRSSLLVFAVCFCVLLAFGCSNGAKEHCEPDTYRCWDNDIQRCSSDGSSWDYYRTCSSAEPCVNGQCMALENCGDGVCDPEENCAVCPNDCPCPAGQICNMRGECEEANGEYCGDGLCAANEDCQSCPEDCGECEAVFSPVGCEGTTNCSLEGCDRSFEAPLYFAEQLLELPHCEGYIPEWVFSRNCFVDSYEWEDLEEGYRGCDIWYLYCPCSDGSYQWAEWDSSSLQEEPSCVNPPSSCVCVPDCEDNECGSDGCGGSCGSCPYDNETCEDGTCVCPPGCRQGSVCCGGAYCAGDCIGTPCC